MGITSQQSLITVMWNLASLTSSATFLCTKSSEDIEIEIRPQLSYLAGSQWDNTKNKIAKANPQPQIADLATFLKDPAKVK